MGRQFYPFVNLLHSIKQKPRTTFKLSGALAYPVMSPDVHDDRWTQGAGGIYSTAGETDLKVGGEGGDREVGQLLHSSRGGNR